MAVLDAVAAALVSKGAACGAAGGTSGPNTGSAGKDGNVERRGSDGSVGSVATGCDEVELAAWAGSAGSVAAAGCDKVAPAVCADTAMPPRAASDRCSYRHKLST